MIELPPPPNDTTHRCYHSAGLRQIATTVFIYHDMNTKTMKNMGEMEKLLTVKLFVDFCDRQRRETEQKTITDTEHCSVAVSLSDSVELLEQTYHSQLQLRN